MLELALYCPTCWDRIHGGPISADMEEVVSCTTCFTETKRSDLLVRNGVTLLDHLVSLNTAKK